MKPAASITLTALLATLSIPLPASSTQPQQDVASTQAQPAAATSSVEFRFERPGLPIPRFTLTISENGHGHYRGEQLQPAAQYDPPPTPQPFDTKFAISSPTTTKIFALSSSLKYFNVPCASKAKNIASTGAKTLHYTAPDGTTTSCTYDYTENKDVQALTEILQAIAETMDQGRRLDFLHRYDRLGLDTAIATLATEASAGRALELPTIAPTLQSLADDPEVMQRVRTRAAALLPQPPITDAPR